MDVTKSTVRPRSGTSFTGIGTASCGSGRRLDSERARVDTVEPQPLTDIVGLHV